MKKHFTLFVGLLAIAQSFAQVDRKIRAELIDHRGINRPSTTSWTINGEFEPNQNRIIVFIFYGEFSKSSLDYPTGISINGVTATQLTSTVDGTDGDEIGSAVISVWRIKDAEMGSNVTGGTPSSVNITWFRGASTNQSNYLLSGLAYRYVNQDNPENFCMLSNNGNDLPSMTCASPVVAGIHDFVWHASLFGRAQTGPGGVDLTNANEPVSTNNNGFLTRRINAVYPTGSGNQGFIGSAWDGEVTAALALGDADGNPLTYTYTPFFQNNSGNPNRWLTLAFKVNYKAVFKQFTGQVWIDKDGNNDKTIGELLPFDIGKSYALIAAATNGPEAGNTIVKSVIIAPDGTFAFTLKANQVFVNGFLVNPEFTLQLLESSGAPSEGGVYPGDPLNPSFALGSAPGTNLPFYVTSATGNYFNASGAWLGANITAQDLSNPNARHLKIGIQSRPFSNDVTASAGTYKGRQFISLAPWPLGGSDSEDGLLGEGNRIVITKLEDLSQTPFNIKVGYDGNANGFDEGDIIEPTDLPFNIPNYNESRLFAYYISGDGAYSGPLFEYTMVDAAGVGSQSNSPLPPQALGGSGVLGSGENNAGVFSLGIILPVGGLELAGVYNAGKANLRWIQKGQQMAARFELERGSTATGFRRIATLNAAGPEIRYTDDLSGFQADDAFYRVKLIRSNGSISYSNVIGLKLSTITTLQLLPTIVGNTLQLRFHNTRSQEISIRVINVTGQVVITQNSYMPVGNVASSLTGFDRIPNGAYTVQVLAGSTLTQGKIVVQH